MLKAVIQPGKEYALREKRHPDAPLQRVKVIEYVRGDKWRAVGEIFMSASTVIVALNAQLLWRNRL